MTGAPPPHGPHVSPLALSSVVLFIVLSLTPATSTAVSFLGGADEVTVTEVLVPRTQACGALESGDSCPCCSCWAASAGMILAYWDATTYGDEGPWDLLLPNGSMTNHISFRAATQAMFDAGTYTGLECCDGWDDATLFYHANGLGYDFYVDRFEDSQVTLALASEELEAGRPFSFGYCPVDLSSSCHAVVGVGVNQEAGTLWVYSTWDHVAHEMGISETLAGKPVGYIDLLQVIPGGVGAPRLVRRLRGPRSVLHRRRSLWARR